MKKENKPEGKEIEPIKDNSIQIHFGNVKLIEIKLLETMNKQLSEILVLMREHLNK